MHAYIIKKENFIRRSSSNVKGESSRYCHSSQNSRKTKIFEPNEHNWTKQNKTVTGCWLNKYGKAKITPVCVFVIKIKCECHQTICVYSLFISNFY